MCGKGIQDKTTGAEAQRDKQVFWDGSPSHNILSMVVSLFSPERILKLIQGARWKQMQQMGMLQRLSFMRSTENTRNTPHSKVALESRER